MQVLTAMSETLQTKETKMALNLQFEGFLNEVKVMDWGTVLRMAHSQRAKNTSTGQWETVGKDYIDVTVDDATGFAEGDLLLVHGSLKVSTYEKRDGSTGIALKVRAVEVSKVERNNHPAGTGIDRALSSMGAVPVLDEETPF
jgi:single-stranded DNA-binding protein